MTNKVFWSAAAAFALLLTLLLYLYIRITAPSRNLQRFLAQVAAVEVGRTRFDSWRKQMESAGISNLNVSSNGIGLQTDNSILWHLHLAPRTVVDASVGFQNGTAAEIYILLFVPPKEGFTLPQVGAVVHQYINPDLGCRVPHYQVTRPRRLPSTWVGIPMDACASAEERSRALAFNTSCLSRIGGCKTVEEILPRVFNALGKGG